MASYYGYAERSAEDQINWSAIGKGMTDMLKEEQDRRDTLKAEIDKASVEFGEVLSSAPQGTHRGMSEYSLDFASDAQNNNLLQLRLLKSGKLKLKDYLVNRENLKQGAGDVFGIMKEYQEKFGEYVARSKSSIGEDGKSIPPQSGFYEAFMLEEVEGFGNLSSTKPYINPTTGKVSIGRRVLQDPSKEYDSVTNPYTARMSDNPSDFRTTQELRFAMSSKTDRFDTAGAIDGIIESFAKEYQVLTKKGSSSTIITDARDMPKFDEVLKTRIDAAFNANPMDALSALGDFIVMGPNGERIGLTRDPKLVNDHTILLVPNPSQPEGGSPVPDFDSDSGKKILDYMTKKVSESVTAGIDRKIQYQRALQPPTPATPETPVGFSESESVALDTWLDGINRDNFTAVKDAATKVGLIVMIDKSRENYKVKPQYLIYDSAGGQGSEPLSQGHQTSRDIFDSVKAVANDSKRTKPYMGSIMLEVQGGGSAAASGGKPR
tara:strand:+ start:7876 stop:9351 length:1476 start_codon:yes stop_codon:yes gene_type:complete